MTARLLQALRFLHPAPPLPEIQDQELVKKNYKYWRFRVFYGMFVGYVFYYFSRKSLTFAMPALMTDLGFTKADLGILASVLSLSYGLSKFISGVLADKSNPRYFMAIGLILTGLFNILFGFSSSIVLFILFWGLNGWFQGFGWPPCARLLITWYSQNERGTWWGFWNTSHSIGGFLITIIAAFIAQYMGWRYALYIPGALCVLMGFFVINRLRDTPQSLGLPPIEKFRNDDSSPVQRGEAEELSVKEILFKYVLTNKYVWVLGIAYFFVYVIRTGINDWSGVYLVEHKGYSLGMMGAVVCWFEVGGIFGSLAAGWFSDRIFRGKRGPINVLFSIATIFALAAFWFSPRGVPLLDAGLIFLIGFLIFGPQMLIGMAAAELTHKRAAASANGFTGWIAYLGAAAAGYPLSKLTQVFGWNGFFWILAGCAGLSALLLLPLWSVKVNPKYAVDSSSEESQETIKPSVEGVQAAFSEEPDLQQSAQVIAQTSQDSMERPSSSGE